MFDPVDSRQSFPALERGILQYWQEEDTFKRSLKQRSKTHRDPMNEAHSPADDDRFNFYDGPPFATGLPHYGHLLAGTIKDVIPRYQTMQGKFVQRRFGWDCHGLPVEYEIEKEYKIASRKEIEEMGVKAFNDLCRTAVQRYTKEWRVSVERMGRWVDMDWDYRTMDPEYMESIWWVFKQLADKKLIYEGHKPMHICPRCQTALSNFEVTQGYKDVTDQSVYAMFELEDSEDSDDAEDSEEKTFVLAWTTTPWTLPGNVFLAVGPHIPYVKVRSEGRLLILGKSLLEKVLKDAPYEVVEELTSTDLVGKKYQPLFPYFADKYKEKGFRIVSGDFVTTEDGTGIVHIAPGFGEDDFMVGKREGVPLLQHVSMDGTFTNEVMDFAGLHVKPKDDPSKADKLIADWLEKNGKLLRRESYKHSYPHCWRCDSPLLNYATSSWFVAVEKIKEDMLKVNAETEWVPSHIRDGRFGKWLENARDWAISRNRYWGTPLPIWRCKETGDIEVIGSREDLMKKKPERFTRITLLRHGESEGNLIPIYQGKLPGTDLSVNGKKQATQTGRSLSTTGVARIYASPLARTQQTAALIGKGTDAEVIVDERLREVEFADYEGKTVDFSDLTFVKARRAHKLETGKVESIYHFPGMETWKDVETRTSDFLRDILPKHRGEHIVVVTHADPMLTMKHFFTGEDPAKITRQPYPTFAAPTDFYWDHQTGSPMDLHKESIDDIVWQASSHESSAEVTFVRHGETDWNAEEKLQGSEADIPLNAKGKAQALELAKSLQGESFDILISSHLQRAVETAQIISKELGIPHSEQWETLRERDLGEWVGRSIPHVLAEFPSIENGPRPSMHHRTPANGESLSQFLKRAEDVGEHLRKKFAGKRILVVSHGGFIQAMRVALERLPYAETGPSHPKNMQSHRLHLHPLFRRIPDVLDCWFESGSMPYAQGHYPFENMPRPGAASVGTRHAVSLPTAPSGFPADFIAEGIDQTRGWFYTLTVLSAALFKKPAFHHCVVNGTVLAEDGKKMSKRLKNYPEPLVVVEKHGADAVRFALMSSPAVRGEDLRFSEKVVEETVRSVLLPLWNTYSFFVTYANACGWEATQTRRASRHPLDRWIRIEVQDLVNRMTEQLDGYDLSATCAELHDTIDALTNWYVRLSRRRFAGKASIHAASGPEKDHETDQHEALATLYDVLLTLSQVLAPFCPFITEEIYLNLVPEDHGSIHLTDWPETRKLKKDEKALLERTRLLRTIVSLGLKIRSDRKIKTRQPLQKVTVAVPLSIRGKSPITTDEIRLIQEELNVKEVEVIDDPGALAQAIVMVDARKVGPRLGGRVQELIAAGKRGEFTVKSDGTILILDETLSASEASVVYRSQEGADAGKDIAADQGIVVSLETAITAELEQEGLARDLIRAIQQLRKDSGLRMEQTISLSIESADDLVKAFGGLIAQETNAKLMEVFGEPHVIELGDWNVTVKFVVRESGSEG